MIKYSLLILFFILSGNAFSQSEVLKIKCIQNDDTINYKGAVLSPLEVSSAGNNNSQIVRLEFDFRHKFYKEYLSERVSDDSLIAYNKKNSIDTGSLKKLIKDNELYIYIEKVSPSKYKVIPDRNHSGLFTDDTIYYWTDVDSDFNTKPLLFVYKVNYWQEKRYEKNIQVQIIPNARFLPKKYQNEKFNSWGGAKNIMTGDFFIGLDSFRIMLFMLNKSILFTKNDVRFSISNPNEKFVNLFTTEYPIYSFSDSIYLGNKIYVFDSISITGDVVFMKEVGLNELAKGVQAGGVIKSVFGNELFSGRFYEVNSNNSQGKATLLHFWGSWCAPCIENLPKLTTLYSTIGDSVNFIGFPYESKKDVTNAKALVKKYNLNWLQILQLRDDPLNRPDVVKDLRIDTFPTYILISSRGLIIERTSDFSRIISRLNELTIKGK
jgi:thiol-disulfide isomerase/thioredoxin